VYKLQRQQKTEIRSAYRSKVMAIDGDGKHTEVATKQKKKSNDGGISVSMLTVEEVCINVTIVCFDAYRHCRPGYVMVEHPSVCPINRQQE